MCSAFKRSNKKLEIRISFDGKTIKMRGQRPKRETEREEESAKGDPTTLGNAKTIDASSFAPRHRPFKKWRELIQKVWEAHSLLCPTLS